MNEEQYRSLCAACDSVLLARDSTIERVAIPWLHVIREHPVFLNDYADLFSVATAGKVHGNDVRRSIRNGARWLRQLVRAARSDGKLWYGPKDLPSAIDVLFISHLLNVSQAGRTDDFYFGELPNELAAQGYSVAIAMINHSGQADESLARRWNAKAVPRFVLARCLGTSEEAKLHRRLKQESSRLRKLAQRETGELLRKVLGRASQEALSGGALNALRMDRQIGDLVAMLKPKVVVVIHEGHAWERIAFAAARRELPNVRNIGYQHAALFRLQHAIRRKLASQYNPDHILSAGTISKTQLECTQDLDGLPVTVLGSNRSFKLETAAEGGIAIPEHSGKIANPACLVLPEGIASECHLMFEFSLECAQALPQVQFIWRLHPLLTHELLAAQNPRLNKLPVNIVLSQATLEQDIACCHWALYRGTTAIVKAAGAGLRPIYLQMPDELTIDPLYALEVWKAKVASVSEFQTVLEWDVEAGGPLGPEASLAREYCESFFLPPDIGALRSLVP